MIHQEEFVTILVNSPVKVNFAGLRGNTRDMQVDGWQLNVEVDRMVAAHGYQVRLIGKHTGLNLRLYSGVALIDMYELYAQRDIHRWFERIEFPISAHGVAKNIMMPAPMSTTAKSFSVNFEEPFIERVSVDKMMSLDDIYFFSSFDQSKTIYIPQEEEYETQKYLDKILASQKDKQKELREKARKKQYRSEAQEMSNDNFNKDLSKNDIKLQLVAI